MPQATEQCNGQTALTVSHMIYIFVGVLLAVTGIVLIADSLQSLGAEDTIFFKSDQPYPYVSWRIDYLELSIGMAVWLAGLKLFFLGKRFKTRSRPAIAIVFVSICIIAGLIVAQIGLKKPHWFTSNTNIKIPECDSKGRMKTVNGEYVWHHTRIRSRYLSRKPFLSYGHNHAYLIPGTAEMGYKEE